MNGRLENWRVEYWCPDEIVIWGNLYDDPDKRFPEGTKIHTSRLVPPIQQELKEGVFVSTKNSIYKLGKKA